MILADTSTWIDHLRGAETEAALALDDALSYRRVIMGDLILVEILQGYRSDRIAREVEALLAPLEVMILGGKPVALKAAENYKLLREKGITVRGAIDVIIATWCIMNGVPLIHADRDFTGMEKWLGLVRRR